MAYLHLILGEGSTNSNSYFDLDGWNRITFRSGDYVEIPNGKHLITFEGSNMQWNIQEDMQSNHCMKIIVLATTFGMVMGRPEYEVKEYDDDVIRVIKEAMADAKEREAARKKEKEAKINAFISRFLMLISIFMFCGALSLVVVSRHPVYLSAAAIIALGGFVLLIKAVLQKK